MKLLTDEEKKDLIEIPALFISATIALAIYQLGVSVGRAQA